MFEITDDSGFIAIIEPERYSSFVNKDWKLEQLRNHFKEQMKQENLLIWSTGGENTWTIKINHGFTKVRGCREIIGTIKVESNRLCLVNYESLTMAAQFADTKLPEEHMKDLLIRVDKGVYDIRIVQYPEMSYDNKNSNIDFLIEIQQKGAIEYIWDSIPWSTDL